MTPNLQSQDLSGRINGDHHELPVRIYYEDTDFSGVVYHANYLKYFERGRSEYMRLIGVHHHQLAALEEPLAFAVSSINIRYLSPARIDDLVCVKSRLIVARGASFKLDQWVERDGQTLAEAQVQVVCIDLNGRPKRLPKDLQAAIKARVAGENAL
ncbi:tol-pal system-associated acyl-CoA thioesterase [Asticcacaulis sp.]|uniref:tol-pal system-associated acyl-CoA thioesterase n=1 Tax=Asticcacaulis sp. TaxID=1872648 RepID=UPI002C1DF2E8|nr:tol-pal system-associated acyl-CoA thioesterase [Asticcacaulis sp.]HTM80953.1 tol-pal system-associated acyl-CoA thioesterase [Asticcacaulis sp.]